MQQFDLSLWLQDKSRKVVTRDGKSVRIICTDGPNEDYQIVGFVENEIATFSWNTSGKHFNGDDNTILDLFFADEEKEGELTEFEQEIRNWMSEFLLGTEQPIPNKAVKQATKKVLELTRKELEKDYCIMKPFDVSDLKKEQRELGEAIGRTKALKDMPKWKKCVGSTGPFIDEFKGEKYLYLNDYVIKVSDLETLPKEE